MLQLHSNVLLTTAIYHFRQVPNALANKQFESGGGIFNGNTIFSDIILAARCFLSFATSSSFPFPSFFRFWQARHSKGALLPPQVINRTLDSSQISQERFLTWREISSSLISVHLYCLGILAVSPSQPMAASPKLDLCVVGAFHQP